MRPLLVPERCQLTSSLESFAATLGAEIPPARHISQCSGSEVIFRVVSSPSSLGNLDFAASRCSEFVARLAREESATRDPVDVSLLLIESPSGQQLSTDDRQTLLQILQARSDPASDPLLTEDDWLLLAGTWLFAVRSRLEIRHWFLPAARLGDRAMEEVEAVATLFVDQYPNRPRPFLMSLHVRAATTRP